MAELLPAGPVLRVEPHDGQEEGGHPRAAAGQQLVGVAQPGGEQDGEEDGDGHEQPEEQVGLRCTVFDFFIKKISIYFIDGLVLIIEIEVLVVLLFTILYALWILGL